MVIPINEEIQQSRSSLTLTEDNYQESVVLSSPPSSYFSPGTNTQTTQTHSPHSTRRSAAPVEPTPYGRPEPNGPRLVTNPTEQYVFEFYVNYAGPWLDIVSQQRHYSCTIPKLALEEPVLYYACLAYSSLLLHLNDGLDKSIHDDFQNRAIAILIPLLPHCATGADEALLATTVILRMGEQFSELAEDAQHHLRGAFSLFTTTQEKWSPTMTHVRGVTFWIYVRECIRASFLNQEGCRIVLDTIDVGLPAPTDDDEVWVNHVTYLLARLCDACWGGSDTATKESMMGHVSSALDTWHADLPNSFRPWYFVRQDYQAFPVVKLLSPWHEIAWQTYYTCKVMLAIHAVNRPKSDSSILGINRYLEVEVMNPARMACAVCFSSPHIGCNFNGCHLIAWCGQFFTGREEQRILAKFLEDFTNQTKWPNRGCSERLQDIWSGRRTEWVVKQL